MRKHTQWWLLAIFLVTIVALIISASGFGGTIRFFSREYFFKVPDYDLTIGSFTRDLKIKKGLDLAGGVRATLRADMSGVPSNQHAAALESAQLVINERIDFLGVTEPSIYSSRVGDEYRLVVELPGIEDTDQALSIIGQTAQLIFKEAPEDSEDVYQSLYTNEFVATELTGRYLEQAQVVFAPQGTTGSLAGEPQVRLIFTQEGRELFAEITQRNISRPVAIYLDDQLISAPTVSEAITEGEAIISGQFSTEQAQLLVQQLNAGALPVPVEVIEQEVIGPTLGASAIRKSIQAGGVGLVLVIAFMVLYYGRLGVLAATALLIYGLITLALYKVIPVTLTLSGIAGFILSIGMAVDSNILIFERMKEELRAGKPLKQAMELGFGRAWDSIRDANVATLITVFILFNPFNWGFLVTSGMVRGFALTLGLGILVSLFTGVIVTRTLVRTFYRIKKN